MVPEITPPRAIGRQSAFAWLDPSLPNLITLARLLSVPVTIWLIVDERYGAAFWLFIGAGVSDALDGFIAKRFDRRTRLGALLDPAADKTLLAGMYVTLGLMRLLPLWRQWMSRGIVSGERFEGPWANIGTPADLAALDVRLINSSQR